MLECAHVQISWVRIRDWHILTNGLVRFTTDDRFNVLYTEGSYDWILQVISMIITIMIKTMITMIKIMIMMICRSSTPKSKTQGSMSVRCRPQLGQFNSRFHQMIIMIVMFLIMMIVMVLMKINIWDHTSLDLCCKVSRSRSHLGYQVSKITRYPMIMLL